MVVFHGNIRMTPPTPMFGMFVMNKKTTSHLYRIHYQSLICKMPAPVIKTAVVGPLAVSLSFDSIGKNFICSLSGKSSYINFATEVKREKLLLKHTLLQPLFGTHLSLFGQTNDLISYRIIEYEASSTTRGRTENWNVQIFDCSGDSR